jgi:hypothetical protein
VRHCLPGGWPARAAIDVAERYADGAADAEELRRAQEMVEATFQPCFDFAAIPRHGTPAGHEWRQFGAAKQAVRYLLGLFHQTRNTDLQWYLAVLAGFAADAVAHRAVAQRANTAWAAGQAERREQAALPRDILTEPQRPVAFDGGWRSPTAVALARGIYTRTDFGAMPILADALAEAGCGSPHLLEHCRRPGAHAKGCWVIDRLLDRV